MRKFRWKVKESIVHFHIHVLQSEFLWLFSTLLTIWHLKLTINRQTDGQTTNRGCIFRNALKIPKGYFFLFSIHKVVQHIHMTYLDIFSCMYVMQQSTTYVKKKDSNLQIYFQISIKNKFDTLLKIEFYII